MSQSDRAPHQQRNRYRLTAEEAGVLLWYRSLPFLRRRCLFSLIARLQTGMAPDAASQLYSDEMGSEG